MGNFVVKAPASKRTAASIFMLVALSLAGCSLPAGPGGAHLTFGYASVAKSLKQVRTMVPGLDIRSGTGCDGISLGWSSVLVAEPVPPGTASTNTVQKPWRYVPPLGWEKDDGQRQKTVGWFYWRRPAMARDGCLFVAQNQAGISLGIGSGMGGLDLGLARQTWVFAPVQSNGLWQLSFRSGAVSATHFESLPTNHSVLQ
ncbi:MAG TPA: hypothetical protein VMF06_05150 [Candidatus Limnocylindria bacterium]|nr:hypothetical protein [Candidatus Limnocylindria bacterium]